MGKFVLLNTRMFTGGVDLTSQSNKVELSGEYEDKDTTNFGSQGSKELIAGLGSAMVSAEGQWEAGDLTRVDDVTWAALGGVGAWTICPQSSTSVGDLAYLTQAMTASYKLGGAVGDVAPWSASGSGTWPLVRGQILHPSGTARTATGTGAAQQLGALTTGRALYVALHVLSVAGTTPSITVRVESDDNSGFTSATTRGTFTAATVAGGQALRIAGPIADDWWRVAWTISGTTPSFLFVTSAGIG